MEGVSMERKAKLFSPLLIAAMLVSLVAGAVGVMVTPQAASAATAAPNLVVSIEIDDYDVEPSNTFTVTANVTNYGIVNATHVKATIVDINGNASLVEPGSEKKQVGDGTIESLTNGTASWLMHCDGPGDVYVTVMVTCAEGVTAYGTNALPYAYGGPYPVKQELPKLLVNIVSPVDNQPVDVGQNFYVNAVITNTTQLTIGNVTANISWAPDLIDPASSETTLSKDVGSIVGRRTADVWWELHCTSEGATTIKVEATGDGGVSHADTVTVMQGLVLLINIVEPLDNDILCLNQTFAVKAYITNVSSEIVATGITANITIVGSATLLPEEQRFKDLTGSLAPGKTECVVWTLKCTGVGDVTITVDADADFTDLIGTPASGIIYKDTIVVHQAPNVPLIAVAINSPTTSTKVCAGDPLVSAQCPETFNVTATIYNNGCAPATHLTATLNKTSGAGTVTSTDWVKNEADYPELAYLAGLSSVTVTWQVTCTGLGDVTFQVEVGGYDGYGRALAGAPFLSNQVTVHQEDFIVTILSPYSGTTFSSNQTFDVTARLRNCSTEKSAVWATIVVPSGAELAAGTYVRIRSYDRNGILKWEKLTEPLAASVNIGTICQCCYVDVTWTLRCTDSTDGWVYVKASESAPPNGSMSDATGTLTVAGPDPYTGLWSWNGTFSGPGNVTVGTYGDFELFYTMVQPWATGNCPGAYAFNGTAVVSISGTKIDINFGLTTVVSPCTLANTTLNVTSGSLTVVNGAITGGLLWLDTDYNGVISTGDTQMSFDSGAMLVSVLDEASVFIKQEWKAHLVAAISVFPGIIDWAQPEKDSFVTKASTTVTAAQYFTVVVPVTNIGEAAAEDVAVTIVVTGDATPKGTLTQNIGTIPGGQSKKAIWELYCDKAGKANVTIEIPDSVAPGVTGKDANTKAAIPVANIEVACAVTLDQAAAELLVEIIQPEDSTELDACQEFCVKALITNTGIVPPGPNVTALIKLTDPVTGLDTKGIRADLPVYEKDSKVIGIIPPGMTYEVGWVVHCLSTGDVSITVVASAAGLKKVSDPVIVHQVAPPELIVEILSPQSYCTYIATSQEFAVTAKVSNPLGRATVEAVAGIGIWVENEPVGTGDGETTVFSLDFAPVIPGSETIYVDGDQILWQVSPLYYSINYTTGTLTFLEAPVMGEAITADYVSGYMSYLGGVSLVEPELTQDLDGIAGGAYKIVTWTLHCDRAAWEPCGTLDTEITVVASSVAALVRGFDDVTVTQYPAAHLVVQNLSVSPSTPITVGGEFTVTADIVNTGWADAWEVSATLSVEPAGNARITSGGYTKQIGTLTGYGTLDSETVSWTLNCKEACNTTITVTATGKDECGWYNGGNYGPDSGQFVTYGAHIWVPEAGPPMHGFGEFIIYPPVEEWGEDDRDDQTMGLIEGVIFGEATALNGPFRACIDFTMEPMGESPQYTGTMVLRGDVTEDPMTDELSFSGTIEMDPPGRIAWDEWFIREAFIVVENGQISGGILAEPAFDGPDFGIMYDGQYCTAMWQHKAGLHINEQFIEPDSVTVKQVEPAALVVESLIAPAQVEVCQVFKVSAIVKNVGGSEATDVTATIDLSGIDATLETGSAQEQPLDDIAAGSLGVASWQLHCRAAGSGAITVTADADNTEPAMAAGGILQVTPAAAICLAVEIDAPAEVTTEQAYFVTAVVTNLCGVPACEVDAAIQIGGEDAGLAELAKGEARTKDVTSAGVACLLPGDSAKVEWEVVCTDVGAVNISVTASGTGTNTAIDSVAVRQAEVLDLSALTTPLNSINAKLSSIDGNVVTIKSDVGTIKGDVADINLTVTSIDEGVATLESNLGTLKGYVSDISDDVATIVTDLGTVKADVSGIADATDTLKSRSIWTLPILILVAIGAIAVIVGVAIVASRKRPVPVVIERKGEE